MRRSLTIALMLSVSLALAACGKRGVLEAPPASDAGEKSVEPKSKEKPHRGFVLDPLLR